MPTNPVQYPVLESIQSRWSPYRFEPRPVEPEKLLRCFEAARWAASSFNDQPWSWIVATRDQPEQFQRMIGCLLESNQGWARNSSAVVITIARHSFAYNHKPNRVALHDLGQANAHFAIQATALGLQVHQMGGVDLNAIRQAYEIPDSHDPQTAMVIGYPDLSEPSGPSATELHNREKLARQRQSLSDLVFSKQWGSPADFLPEIKST